MTSSISLCIDPVRSLSLHVVESWMTFESFDCQMTFDHTPFAYMIAYRVVVLDHLHPRPATNTPAIQNPVSYYETRENSNRTRHFIERSPKVFFFPLFYYLLSSSS